jgi:peptidyl-tRNA hydrolase
LIAVHLAAQTAGVRSSLITDAGLTEFAGVPTNTCVAIGPAWNEKVDAITGALKLL